VFRRERRLHERVRQGVGIEEAASRALRRQRLVERGAVPVDDLRRHLGGQADESPGQRTDTNPADAESAEEAETAEKLPAARGWPAPTAEPDRPNTSGSYISSARAGAVPNVPAVVARTTYEKTCSPSASRVAKRSTRSSWRSTWSKPPLSHQATQSPRWLSASSCSWARSAAVVANHDSTGSNPAGSGSVTATKRRSLGSRNRREA